MSKAHRQIKQTAIQRPNEMGQQFEHTETFDDNLLPGAEEIAKLHVIDPTIMDWLKARAEKEQEFRHTFHSERLDIIKRNEGNTRTLNIIGMICAFILFAGGMAFSCYLIEKGCTLTGTIFTGITLLLAASLFITRKINTNKINKTVQPQQDNS